MAASAPPTPATVGTLIEGLQLTTADDDLLLERGITLFESLYRAFAQSARASGPRPLAKTGARSTTAVRRRACGADTAHVDRGPCAMRDTSTAHDPAPLDRGATASASGDATRASSPGAPLCRRIRRVLSATRSAASPLLPLFAHELGAGPSAIGLVVGASTVTGIFVKLPAGALSDILGRRPLLLAGALVFALMPFTYLGASSLAALIVLRVLHGSATAVFGPVASATVSDLAPLAQRGAWLGTYATAQGAGQALGPALAGYLIAAGRFDLAFIAAGVVGLAAPLIVGTWSPALPVHDAPTRWPAFRAGILEVLRHRLILVTSAAHAAQFVLNGALSAFLPLYGRDVFGLTTPQLGWLFAAQTVTTLAARPLIGAMSDRVGGAASSWPA